MPSSGPVVIPPWAWQTDEARHILAARDGAGLLRFAQQHTGVSQSRLAIATGMLQGRTSEIMSGRRNVTALEVYERIADGLAMPDDARMALGLAPLHPAGLEHLGPAGRAEILAVFGSQQGAAADIRRSAREAREFTIVAVRGLGIIGFNDSLLRSPARNPGAIVRALLLNPDCAAARRRATEIEESPESFSAGIRLAIARLAELADSAEVELFLYDTLPTWRIIGLDATMYVSAFGDQREGHESAVYKIAPTPFGALHRGFDRMTTELRQQATRAI